MKTMRHRLGSPLFPVSLMLNLLATIAIAGPSRLPCGPEGAGRFGGYQTLLPFTPEWDAPWRLGPRTDVVVRFDQTAARLVFWHGANFVPCWVNEQGLWYSDGAVVRPGAGPHQDRLCRFSFATVIESSDARVVVRWRYAPADEHGGLINADPMTRWNDWVDEFYTIYPDATGVRSVTLHSSDWTQPHGVQQSILIRQPGEPGVPDVALKSSAVLGGLVQWLDCTGSQPFHAVAGTTTPAKVPATWGDWPARGAAEKAGHGFVGALQWDPCAGNPTSKSWRLLIGMETGGEAGIKAIARSWLAPPTVKIDGGEFTTTGYQPDEKAYHLTAKHPGNPGPAKLTLAGNPTSPVLNPAFVLKGWGRSAVSLTRDGSKIPPGKDFRYGYRKTATGADLILWIRASAEKPTAFEILSSNGHE